MAGEPVAEQPLIALTSGELRWPEQGEVPDVLPPALRASPLTEPRWTDLRSLRTVQRLDRQDPQATNAIAELAAPVRGVEKDQLVGAHVRYHRRAMRLLSGGVAGLALLLVLAVVAGLIAFQQRNLARDEARIATARELAAVAVRVWTSPSSLPSRPIGPIAAPRRSPPCCGLSARVPVLCGFSTRSPRLPQWPVLRTGALSRRARRTGTCCGGGWTAGLPYR